MKLRPARVALAAAVLTAVLATIVVGTSVAATNASSRASATKMSIGLSSWIGYSALWIAADAGMFKNNGLDVNLVQIDDPTQRLNALKAGRLTGSVTSLDTWARTIPRGIPATQVMAIDSSYGGDGILVDKSITSIAGLKGQTVAVAQGSTGEFLLSYVLNKAGLSLKDIKESNLSPGDAGAAFAAGRVKAAVTWEPWLTNALKKNKNGKLLVSTRQGDLATVMLDTLGFRNDVIKKQPKDVSNFVRALGQAVDYMKSHPKEALAIVSKRAKVSVAEAKALLTSAKLFNIAENKAYLGTVGKRGPVNKIYNLASQFWITTGQLTKGADPNKVIDPSFVNGIK
jgi:NitT/TauT family transport system substrate-binding protein